MKDRGVFAGIFLGALQKKKILFCILFTLITIIACIGWALSHPKNLPLDEVKKVAIKNGNTGNQIELSDEESMEFINTLQSFDFQRSRKIKEEAVGWSVWVSLENGNKEAELFLEETYIEYNNYFYKTKSTDEYLKFWEYWLANSKYDFMEDTAMENAIFSESFGKAVTQIDYYAGSDIPYVIKDETIIQEFFDILSGLTYREIKNPMYEGGYSFGIYSGDKVYDLWLSKDILGFEGNCYSISSYGLGEQLGKLIQYYMEPNIVVNEIATGDYSIDIVDKGYNREYPLSMNIHFLTDKENMIKQDTKDISYGAAAANAEYDSINVYLSDESENVKYVWITINNAVLYSDTGEFLRRMGFQYELKFRFDAETLEVFDVQKEKEPYSITMAYTYPVVPGSDEWNKLSSFNEKVAVCQIPEDILQKLYTDALVESVVNCPIIVNMFAHDTVEFGFDQVKGYFNGLSELCMREDAVDELKVYAENLDSEDVISVKVVETLIEYI